MSPEQLTKTIVLHNGSPHAIAAISAADRLDKHELGICEQ